MCGIVGYIGNNAAADVLLDGLKNLEYRGYDSAGMALNDNGCIDVFRASGKLCNLYDKLSEVKQKISVSRIGIGHIRWATHGGATIDNAHPHKSNDGRLVLVHNGIIENYEALKLSLQKKGYNFFSQTDTEAAVHLIDDEYKQSGSLETAVVRAVNRLKGAFAFCIMHENEADKIIAVRKNAPLIIGLGEGENFIASDVPAIIGKAKQMIYLDDNELAIVRRDGVSVKNFDGSVVLKKVENLTWEPEAISKRGFKHFMLKEINEQPDIVRNLLTEYMPSPEAEVRLGGIDLEQLFRGINRMEIIACGTSLHAAKIAQNAFETLAGIPVRVEAASEYIYKRQLTSAETLTIGISQSGETADTITALKQARSSGAKVLAVTNRTDSSIVRCADAVLPLKAGIEVSVAATKSYTAQLVCLYLSALAAAELRGCLSRDKLFELKKELFEIPAKLEETLSNSSGIKTCAKDYAACKNVVFMARGINTASAAEGALKLKEISYINANGYEAGELKHGPIALLDESVPVIAILADGGLTFDKMLSNCEEVKARRAQLIAVTTSAAVQRGKLFDRVIRVPQIAEIWSPLLLNVPLQLLAYYIADELGREIDQPRNLAKSVTVE